MDNICLYLNGDRGKKILEELIRFKFKKVFVFTTKEISSLKFYNSVKVSLIKKVNTEAHINLLKKIRPSISIVAGFSELFSEEIIKIPFYGTINCHAGPLPQYRGGSPLNWQIINGENKMVFQ